MIGGVRKDVWSQGVLHLAAAGSQRALGLPGKSSGLEGPLDLQDVVATTMAWGQTLLTVAFVYMTPSVGVG